MRALIAIPLSSFYLQYSNGVFGVQCEENRFSKLKMEYSAVYFRHGTRTPLHVHEIFKDFEWPKELVVKDTSADYMPYKLLDLSTGKYERPESYYDKVSEDEVLLGGATAGILTLKGQKEAFSLGQTLKERYLNEFGLISQVYDPSQVQLYSTNFIRTIESMQAVLSGFFGKENVKKDQIPVIRTRPNEVDYNFPNAKFCPSVGRWVNYAYSAQYTVRQCDALREKLLKFMTLDQLPAPLKLSDGVFSLLANEIPIPDHFMDLLPELENCASHVEKWAMHGESSIFMKRSFGKAIDDIFVGMESAMEKNSGVKLSLTACHDTIILALLTTVGGFDEKWPKLAGYLAFELFRDIETNKYYVRVVYNGKAVISRHMDNDGLIEFGKFCNKCKDVRLRGNWVEYCNKE